MAAFIDISDRLILVLIGLQVAGAMVAGLRGLAVALALGIGMFGGVTLMVLVQPPTGIDDLGAGVGLVLMVIVGPGLLIGAALLISIALWAIRRRRMLRGST
ncbi:MAG TPA: hypothetical protein VLA52_05050 [Thermohalobaculum sp.]|nr:hypothetical protein [Thermohalobaculum sp.]